MLAALQRVAQSVLCAPDAAQPALAERDVGDKMALARDFR